jgi:AraC family transcriptional regulator
MASDDRPNDTQSGFPVGETHGIAGWAGNRLIADSARLGWRNIYASLAFERPWSATLAAVPHATLAYCLNRSATITRAIAGERAQTMDFGPRQFGIVPSDVSSRWEVRGSPEVLLLYLRRSLIERIAAETFERDAATLDIAPTIGTTEPLLEQIALAIHDALRAGDDADRLYVDSLAAGLGVHMLRTYAVNLRGSASLERAEAHGTPPGLRRVRDYIEARLDADLTLDRLAAECGLSVAAFARAFCAHFGEPPHRYVVGRRIERAKYLLSATDLPIVEVALATGFASQSHLATAFRRQVGLTPAQFRRH